ncbi:MAG: hypothetical protein DMG72_19565 [Acidobacteria bacterium]|nr:MAG: hypothetical protein DMG72_19565 [Acidobacteriota bacterium]
MNLGFFCAEIGVDIEIRKRRKTSGPWALIRQQILADHRGHVANTFPIALRSGYDVARCWT